jgi:protein TonB
MFDDFRPDVMSREERARMGGSAAAAAVMYALLAAALIGGTTVASKHVVEKLTQVEFATKLPEPPPPPPQPVEAVAQPPQNARPKTKRRELKPPDHVPDEKPKESAEPLTAAEPAGPVGGFLTGVEGGTGTARKGSPAPPPKPETLTAPVPSKSNVAPTYTAVARRKEIEGVVVVAFDVLENGSVTNVTIVSGPNELRDNVLKTVATWRFQPAKRGNTPLRQHLTKSIRFRLSDE